MNLSDYGNVLENVSLKDYNTFKVNSIVKELIVVNDPDKLKKLISVLDHYFIIGNGSNITLCEDYYDYPFIKLDFKDIIVHDDNLVYVGASVLPVVLINKLYEYGLGGLEWASGIPGTMGGIIYNNAGAYNEEIKNFVKSIKVLDKESLEIREMSVEEAHFGYRESIFKETKKYIILGVTLLLNEIDVESSKELIQDRLTRRLASQPLEYPSAGSVFRNPEGDFAGRLIEENGFKGYHVNDAYVSEKHANFIVNKGNATGYDIINLIDDIKAKVKEENNVDLILEQEIIK